MLEKSYEYLKNRLGDFVPDTAVILGSGLGGIVAALHNAQKIAYTEIPDFPQTTVAGHNGCFYIGTIGKHNILCLQGRFHLYEGIKPQLIYEIIRLLKRLGTQRLIVTNAAGSLKTDMPAGSLMLITDHLNLSGQNPLIGPHDEPYFPDMSEAYNIEMRQKILQIAQTKNIPLAQGIYALLVGPNYETPAEVKMLQLLGADAVGMSTVPEVISAVHLRLKVAGISVISNLCTGLSPHKPNHEDVLHQVGIAAEKLSFLITEFLEKE
ncbi:MAG: purine-nucleoside phosphorylase [Alphaproteobacteria bacterium]|nr:purine-nucleoside phosphorylase [Alphaproteobacteria bacterium]